MEIKGVTRCWINQPSTFQPYHKFHGEKVIAIPPVKEKKGIKYVLCAFVTGDIVAMDIQVLALSKSHGW